ncbi:MAG: hypothetical protein EOS56_06980 [Mesorhizobium sp.]|nr:MAG: hypothetical protein EOS55_24285 [Mesorhizobium sp.]RWC62920.1 MAG: hypothetical protein EOS56_06980 [Mesorhizobium sp.]RWC65657.1 MAG: hypothetical protein EOS29_08150 [Mesorhizobium sp.]
MSCRKSRTACLRHCRYRGRRRAQWRQSGQRRQRSSGKNL